MNINDLKKKLNSGSVKYSDDEMVQIIKFLKRLAEIEHTSYLIKKNKL